MKKYSLAIVGLVLVGAVVAGVVSLKPWASKMGTGRYGDWLIKCESKNTGTAAESTQLKTKGNCLMTQLILTEKGEEQVLAVAIGFWPGKDRPQIAFHMPPNIEKAEGLTLQVDEGGIYKIPVGICTSSRCTALDYIPEEVKQKMLTGQHMVVTYKLPGQDQRVGILVSLKGFEEALHVLEKNRS